MKDRTLVCAFGAAILSVATPCAALAQPAPATAGAYAEQGSTLRTLSDGELDSLRGGDGHTIIVSKQVLNAVTTGNVINGNVAAGNVTISDSAFSNFNGLGNIIINTGAQVSVQSGMNVTINTMP